MHSSDSKVAFVSEFPATYLAITGSDRQTLPKRKSRPDASEIKMFASVIFVITVPAILLRVILLRAIHRATDEVA